MDASYEYEIWHTADYPEYAEDSAEERGEPLPEGWYWWWCMPGYMPSSDPYGPFESYEAAEADVEEIIADEKACAGESDNPDGDD